MVVSFSSFQFVLWILYELIGDTDQPRVTTATHPTTSTQTRSTPRPQVHVTSIPAGMRNFRPGPPAIQLSSFDR